MFKRFLSLVMSCLIATSSFLPGISAASEANGLEVAKNQDVKCVEKIEWGTLKEFAKNNPYLVWFGLSLILDLAFKAYNAAVYEWKFRRWDVNKVATKIDNLSDEEIDKKIDEEIEKYKNRAPDVFKVEDKLAKESDKRLFLLTIMKLNHLFDKYSGFTERLIDYKRNKADDKEFLLRRITLKDDGLSVWLKALQAT